MRWLSILLVALFVFPISSTWAMTSEKIGQDWKTKFASIPIQDRGRTMPMDTFARRLAVEITGRTNWSNGQLSTGNSRRDHIDLLADLLFKPEEMLTEPLIPIGRKTLKVQLELDPSMMFFSPRELMRNDKLYLFSSELQSKMEHNHRYRPSPDEKALMDAQKRITALSFFVAGKGLAIVPVTGTDTLARAGFAEADSSALHVQLALITMRETYLTDGDMDTAVDRLTRTINSIQAHTPAVQSKINLELLYNTHNPWRMAVIATFLAMLLLTLRWIVHSRTISLLVVLAIIWAIAEQAFGLWLRVSILDRAPVTNTYEALLWIGIVAIVCGVLGQLLSPRSWYLAAGLGASLLAILFAMLVPIADQTNSLPAVLRSNYWLIIHVLTIVTSFGALLLAAVLAHIYLIKDVLLHHTSEKSDRIIVQIYRMMQFGVILLTAGTILGGVWAADSWGRFWGWDPKETWSLISIMIYFALLHARYVGWIHDFGLAVVAIVGFLAIVWTFYGVNCVMASGLHSYGFGSGGDIWIAIWAVAEIVFINLCFVQKPSDQ